MPEFYDVAARRIELAHNRGQPRLCIVVARRKLKKKTPHPFAKDIRDDPKILHEGFRADEALYVRDVFIDLNCVDETLARRLTPPGLDICDRRPRVKRCIDLHGVEAFRVMLKPVRLLDAGVE